MLKGAAPTAGTEVILRQRHRLRPRRKEVVSSHPRAAAKTRTRRASSVGIRRLLLASTRRRYDWCCRSAAAAPRSRWPPGAYYYYYTRRRRGPHPETTKSYPAWPPVPPKTCSGVKCALLLLLLACRRTATPSLPPRPGAHRIGRPDRRVRALGARRAAAVLSSAYKETKPLLERSSPKEKDKPIDLPEGGIGD